MIACKFVYVFRGGGASDSLNQVYQVHAIPNVGDNVWFLGTNGEGAKCEVKAVDHYIRPTEKTHEIVVSYGPRSDRPSAPKESKPAKKRARK